MRWLASTKNQLDTYFIKSSPFTIFKLFAIPPRFTDPLYPPTLRQMLHAQSWYGIGVLDSRVNSIPPHWQLPSRCLRIVNQPLVMVSTCSVLGHWEVFRSTTDSKLNELNTRCW